MQTISGEWSLAEFGSVDIAGLKTESLPGMTIEEGSLHGSTGINRFSAELDADLLAQGKFATGPARSTRRAGPPEAMDLEQRLLEVLAAGHAFEVRSNDLVLLASDGSTVMRFARKD